MFSLESPHRGDSYEYTQYTIFNMNRKKHPKLSQIYSSGHLSKGRKNKFETAMVNEPSVFEPLKFYCTEKNRQEQVKTFSFAPLRMCSNFDRLNRMQNK